MEVAAELNTASVKKTPQLVGLMTARKKQPPTPGCAPAKRHKLSLKKTIFFPVNCDSLPNTELSMVNYYNHPDGTAMKKTIFFTVNCDTLPNTELSIQSTNPSTYQPFNQPNL